MANTAISTTIYPKDVSLDDAYNLGSSITVDSGAVYFNVTANNTALDIDTVATTTHIIDISAASLTTGTAINIPNLNAIAATTTGGAAINIASNSSEASARDLIRVINDNIGATGTCLFNMRNDASFASLTSGGMIHLNNVSDGNVFWIQQDGNMKSGSAAFVVNTTGTQNQGATALVYINNGGSGNTPTMKVINGCSSYGIRIEQTNVSYAANTLSVYSNVATVQADSALVKLTQDSASATEPALEIVNDGTGYGIELNQVGIGYGLYAYSNAIMTATQLVRIHQQNASSTQPALMVIDTGTIDGVYFVQAGNGDALQIDSQGITTYAGINVNMAGTLTTGQAIYALSNSSTFTGTGLVQIIQDHASATGNCLYLRQDGVGQALYIYSANVLAAGAHGIYIYSNSANTNGDTALMKIAQDNASCLEPCYYAYNGGAGPAIFTNQITVSNASYPSIYFYSNAIQVNAPLVRILQNNSSSTKAALSVESNGTYSALIIGGTASSIQILEQAAANNDTAAYGQIWVKNDTPNKLYFTDDAGTDYPVAGSGIAATGAPKIQDVAVKYINSSASLASNTWTALSGGTGSTITFTLTVTSDVKLFLEIDYWNGSGLRQLKFRYNDGSTTFNETTITEDTPSGSTPYFNSYTLTSKAAGTYNISIEYFSGDGGNETFYMRGTNTAYIKVN